MKITRNLDGNNVQDPSTIANLEYNGAAGAQKQIDVGPKLLPLSADGSSFTTNVATTAMALPSAGRSLAVYNNDTAVGAITLGETAASVGTPLAAGVCDASGHVGIPCAPGTWTYISCGSYTFVKSSAATLLVFLIDDDSSQVKISK